MPTTSSPPPHLANVHLTEFTENVPRSRSTVAPEGVCGALPARALAGPHPSGCIRDAGHHGSHSVDRATAVRLQRRAARA